jgi:hypothetical protein
MLSVTAVFFLSCNKSSTERNYAFPSLVPAKTDINAGTWKTVLLSSPTEFTVPAPVATSSPAYAAEINEIKGFQRSLTDKQKEIISFWSAGAVLRWNEILRELVARHNLAPYQDDAGVYPAPSAANPFAYPQFPFSNPPYASRAYAYASAAQYDALVAAWHYKKLYNRSAPYKFDSTIKALVPRSDLPSYPSEDAVVEGAAVEILKLLFPTEIAYVQQRADEHRQYRIMSGANVRSEMEAGEALGRQVAQKFAARARTDKAGAAIGNAVYWKQLETDAIARGEDCWISLESPKRPPMLPLFCKVIPFLFDTLTVTTLRPPPPPSTKSEAFKKEVEEVLYFSRHTTRERTALIHFWADLPPVRVRLGQLHIPDSRGLGMVA